MLQQELLSKEHKITILHGDLEAAEQKAVRVEVKLNKVKQVYEIGEMFFSAAPSSSSKGRILRANGPSFAPLNLKEILGR